MLLLLQFLGLPVLVMRHPTHAQFLSVLTRHVLSRNGQSLEAASL